MSSNLLAFAFVAGAAIISCIYMRRNQWKITPRTPQLAGDLPEYWETDTKSIINPNQNLSPNYVARSGRSYFD